MAAANWSGLRPASSMGAQRSGFHDLFDNLHVLVKTGLETDGQNFSALLLSLHDLNTLFQGYAHGLFKKDVDSLVQRVDGTLRMGRVVCAYADGIQLFRIQHGFVVRI